jgi:thiosulfate dehydrogenase
MGVDGAYSSGSHLTGFPGVFDARGISDGGLLAWLNGSTSADHDFSAMGEEALGSLVTFLQEGLVDLTDYISYESKAPLEADAAHGEELYAEACQACHGEDGRTLNFGSEDKPEYVGTIAQDNPWEFTHKVRNGQPGEAMPAAIDGGWAMQDVMDVLAYAQTLPAQSPAAGSISRGGRLYDKWWKEAAVDEPAGDFAVFARQDSNTRSGTDTYRCKECHGWDYMGADGVYASGSHFTGFPGIFAAQDKTIEELAAQISGAVDPDHDFSALGEEAIVALASFIQEGLVDLTADIDKTTKTATQGDASAGEELYASTCTACHGDDGRMINFGDADDPEFVGTIARDNPWEFIHKVRFGQPATNMPNAFDAGWTMQAILDLLTFSQSLPTEAP